MRREKSRWEKTIGGVVFTGRQEVMARAKAIIEDGTLTLTLTLTLAQALTLALALTLTLTIRMREREPWSEPPAPTLAPPRSEPPAPTLPLLAAGLAAALVALPPRAQ